MYIYYIFNTGVAKQNVEMRVNDYLCEAKYHFDTDEFSRQCTYPLVQVFVLLCRQQRESRYMSAACILYRLSRISERLSRCSKLDVNRKWLADAKVPPFRRRDDGTKGAARCRKERGRIFYGLMGLSYCVSFQSKLLADRISKYRQRRF